MTRLYSYPPKGLVRQAAEVLVLCLTGAVLVICLTGAVLAQDSNRSDSAKPRGFTTAERMMVFDALHAFEMRIDPEYYLSGEYLKDLGAQTSEQRRRRAAEIRRMNEIKKRAREREEMQRESRERQIRLAATNRREQAERHAKWRAQVARHQRHRCALHRRNQSLARARARQNPNYIFRPSPNPPGC